MAQITVDTPRSKVIASTSIRIIAAAMVVAAIYYASAVLITLISSLFLAFMLDPGVVLLERLRVPRWLGSLLMVMITLALFYLLLYLAYGQLVSFLSAVPKLSIPIHRIALRLESRVFVIFQSASNLLPSNPENPVPTVRLLQKPYWFQYLETGFMPIYNFAITAAFVPFLVFFMLAQKHHVWVSTLRLFPISKRQQTEDVIGGIGHMVRRFVLGNVLVALISTAILTPVFLLAGLPNAFLLGALSAVLSLIPYLGMPLSMIPPLLTALAQYETAGPLVGIVLAVILVHFVAINVLTPKVVGRTVKLNALAVTLAMLVWAALWGAIGLVLAIPITAAIKAVCDNIPSLRAYGSWMGD
jgi:predicted PurR-regulated permease PerM